MSYKPSETGRVKSIKSKFENLNSLESLDISASIPHKYRKPSPSQQFKRSATSFDFSYRKIPVAIGNNGVSNTSSTTATTNENGGTKSFLSRRNNLAKTLSADASPLKKRNSSTTNGCEDELKPLKEIKENVEGRLSRHINDPVKRSSIKRSPAFRVGDTSTNGTNNTNNNKSIKANAVKSSPTVPKEFSDKFDELLKRCVTDSQKLQEAGLTDTLKAVLRQPLPTGPPPKKPPRTFIDSPATRNHVHEKNTNTSEKKSAPRTTSSPTGELKQKIDMLENQLILKPATKLKATNRGRPSPKDKNPFSSSLFNCIPCSSAPVYDTMVISRNQSNAKNSPIANKKASQLQSCDVPIPNTSSPTSHNNSKSMTPTAINHTHSSRTKTEHIYMEPFAHLKSNAHNNSNYIGNNHSNRTNHSHSQQCMNNNNNYNSNSGSSSFSLHENSNVDANDRQHMSNESKLSSSFSNGSLDGESLGSSLVSCASCAADDHSITDFHDIHYMVSLNYFQLYTFRSEANIQKFQNKY